jgi:hypothetical protein
MITLKIMADEGCFGFDRAGGYAALNDYSQKSGNVVGPIQGELAYHVDHVIPVAAGGTNNLNNLVIACPICNLIASSKVFPSLMAKKLFVLNVRRNRA